MANNLEHRSAIAERAAACAARLPTSAGSAAEALANASGQWSQLVDAVRAAGAEYAFDRDGRPSAVNAIRHALPAIEREILDAVIEDHECELAAIREAMYQLLIAVRTRGGGSA